MHTMPPTRKDWGRHIQCGLGDKDGMKEGKLVRKTVRKAIKDPAFSGLDQTEAAQSLRAYLAW